MHLTLQPKFIMCWSLPGGLGIMRVSEVTSWRGAKAWHPMTEFEFLKRDREAIGAAYGDPSTLVIPVPREGQWHC